MTRSWKGSKWIRKERRVAIYIRDQFRCLYCGDYKVYTPGTYELTLDHVKPTLKGGTNKSSNLATCCEKCNFSKQEQSLIEFVGKAKAALIKKQLRKKLNINQAKNFIEIWNYFDKV